MLNVKLTDGVYKEAEEKGKEYLLYLDVDRLIAPCYESVSQPAKKPRYGGWESMQISGHSIGHWLSATAAMYATTGDVALKQKLDYAVDELALVQSFDADGYVSGFPRACFDEVFTGQFRVHNFGLGGSWVPWYSLHKIFAGLIDAYQLADQHKALEVVTKLSDWAYHGLSTLSDEQFQRMLICEHGGMNEAMADMFLVTGEEKYLALAKRFCHQAILDPLANARDDLEGKHANTQIPKVIGAAKLYNITGEQKYRDMSQFFWNQVTNYRSYVIGGNSIGEHFGAENAEELGILTTETCNTYNMLKLTEYLFAWSPHSKYMDYYERALYNHILASQDSDSGMKTYFVSTQPGHFKVYNSPDDSFWCCTGTGMENPARYTRNIYYRTDNKLYVNLFIASSLSLEDKQIKLIQETSFPETGETKLIIKEAAGERLDIRIRLPYWLAEACTAIVNGQEEFSEVEDGYLLIDRSWSSGDQIDIHLPMQLHLHVAKDDPQKKAILYGPVVLAGALGTENFPESDILADHQELNNHPLIHVPTLVTEETELHHWITPIKEEALAFKTDPVGQPGDVSVTLIPFYQLHHQRYTLYWRIMNEAEFNTFEDKESKEKERRREITVDEVIPGEQQPEVDHQLQSLRSNSGYLNLAHRSWRDSRDEGFFSYKMKVHPEQPMYLLVTYYGSDARAYIDGKWYEREFHILVDNQVIAQQLLNKNKFGQLFDVCYEIPTNLTLGKEKVEVKFASTEGKAAGRIFGLRIVNEKDFY